MNKKVFNAQDKELLKNEISGIFAKRKEIVFAYIFGSFVSSDRFKDIDIGVYVLNENINSLVDYELELEREIEGVISIPADVRVINNAPLSFVFNVIKNKALVLERDSSMRADFEGLILKKYFDFRRFRLEYLKEVRNAPV